MQLNEREVYAMKRRRLRISMAEIAREIGCSKQLISFYELGDCGMREELIRAYQSYIDSKQKQ